MAYTSLRSERVISRGVPAFTHDVDVREGRAPAGVHQRLNPSGLRMRESRDSADHPESLAIGVMFDVTGSMGTIPALLQSNLSRLMGLLVERGFVAHPQVLFGAIGDATYDRAPLQLGQFESDVRMDEDIDKIFREGGGGGHHTESYELADYVFARHTAIDCWEKRQAKGFLFTVGDEMPYPRVHRLQVRGLLGHGPQEDVATEAIVAEVQQRYHRFHLLATQGSAMRGGAGAEIRRRWQVLLGDAYVIDLDQPQYIAEIVATVIGLVQQTVTAPAAIEALRAMGVDATGIMAVERAVDPLARAIVLR